MQGENTIGRKSCSTDFACVMQRVRFSCALAFSVCLGCDYMTVYLPHLFILLAGIANIGKAVSITAYASTQPAIMRSFARDDNIADVTARCQAQNMVVDQAAILLASGLTWSVRNNVKWQFLLPLVRAPTWQLKHLRSLYSLSPGQRRSQLSLTRQRCYPALPQG